MINYTPEPPTTGKGAFVGALIGLILTITLDYIGWVDGSIILFTFYVTAIILGVIGDQVERNIRRQP